MKKQVKLVLVPFEIDKPELGMLARRRHDKQLLIITKDNWHQVECGWEDEKIWLDWWQPVIPYLVCDDEIKIGDGVCELLTTGEWMAMTIHNENDFDLQNQKKIIAFDKQIGMIYPETDHGDQLDFMNADDFQYITEQDGKCFVEIDSYNPESNSNFSKPRLISDKVVVHFLG